MAAKSNTRTIIRIALFAIFVVILILKVFFISIYSIPQNGMYPGLPAGTRLYAKKHPYSNASSVKRGDIIIFKREEEGQPYTYIWRVIGLPGDKIETSGQSLSINGQPVQRQHVRDADGSAIFREQLDQVSYEVAFLNSPSEQPPDVTTNIPPGQFFVMGDNRLDARDSRTFGPISFSTIIGKKF